MVQIYSEFTAHLLQVTLLYATEQPMLEPNRVAAWGPLHGTAAAWQPIRTLVQESTALRTPPSGPLAHQLAGSWPIFQIVAERGSV